MKLWRARPKVHLRAYEGVLGTSAELVLRLDPKEPAGPIFERMLAEIDRLAAIFSVYDADSELMRWQATSGPQAVSEELARVLNFAETMRVRTGGAFNPAVQLRLADPENAVEMPSGPTYVVDLSALTATRLSSEPLTLNGVAKGAIIDAAVEVAMREGADGVLVNIGGDLRQSGKALAPVVISDPRSGAENAEPVASLPPTLGAFATSGEYRRGKHIVGFDDGIASVTVVAPTAMEADAWSTALAACAFSQAKSLAEVNNISSMHVFSDGKVWLSPAWVLSF